MDERISSILSIMSSSLDNEQLVTLHAALIKVLAPEAECSACENKDLLKSFLDAKGVEGCSVKTIEYYRLVITMALEAIDKPMLRITTGDLRSYLSEYQEKRGSSPVTINNMRRVLSSFFSWLEDEGVLLKSPMRRIKPIKTPAKIKPTYTNEQIEKMREATTCIRDLAIIDLLTTTGMRVSELVSLDRSDFDIENRECVVLGKGNKERTVYFDDRTKMHVTAYFATREDELPAAFISRSDHSRRLGKDGIEKTVREIGDRAGVEKAHPHKFRRTLATRAIGKGMPIEQVQHLLGHQRIDTTLHYAMVDEANVKISHRRFIC